MKSFERIVELMPDNEVGNQLKGKFSKEREIVIEKIKHFKKLVRSRIDSSDLDAFHRVSVQVNEIINEDDVFKI